MGSWDYYCAFCGSTFKGLYFVCRKPRTARFLWRKQRDAEFDKLVAADPLNGRIDFKKFNEETATGEDSLDTESLASIEEEHSYDPTVISQEEASWSLNLQALGINPDSPVSSQIFISGIGCCEDYGDVSVEPGSDPSAPEYSVNHSAYQDTEEEPYFPFHPKCFGIFQRVIAFQRGSQLRVKLLPGGEWDLNTPCLDLDKDLLWEIFVELTESESQYLNISYGDPSPPQDQYWFANEGEEFFIADPGRRNDLAVNTIHDIWHTMTYQDTTPLFQQPNDIFVGLPWELLLILTSTLESGELLNLLQASAHLRRGLGRNTSFWLQRFQADMPWFYEIHTFLHGLTSRTNCDAQSPTTSHNATGLSGKSLSHFFAWAQYTTTPRCGLKGPFMGIANRRRIWDVCKQVVDPYLARSQPRSQPGDTSSELEEEAQFRDRMVCLDMPVVASPAPDRFHTERVLWVRTWSELNATKGNFTLNVFLHWDCLMGLELKMDNEKDSKLKLLGHDDGEHDRQGANEVSKKSMRIGSGDWIIGFILHWPDTHWPDTHPNDGFSRQWCEKGVTGITVLCSSGLKESFGEIEPTYIQRPLLASKDMTIVGLIGTYASEKEGFIRLGLLQVSTPNIDNSHHLEARLPAGTVPSWAESRSWANDCTEIFTTESLGSTRMDTLPAPFPRAQTASGVPIWDVPNLHIQELDTDGISHSHPDEFIAYGPLIWAKDVEEAHALRRLTGYIKQGNTANGLENGKTWERPVHHLFGARAEFAPESALERRYVGMVELHEPSSWQPEYCLDFDVDGAGGEMITAVAVAMEQCSPKAVKLITNRGREAHWGGIDKPEERWQVLTAPEGEMLIGIVVAFSRPSASDKKIPRYLRSRIRYLATLSLPMK